MQTKCKMKPVDGFPFDTVNIINAYPYWIKTGYVNKYAGQYKTPELVLISNFYSRHKYTMIDFPHMVYLIPSRENFN